MQSKLDHLEFHVEIWAPGDIEVEETVAAGSNALFARAAFDKVVEMRNHQIVRLRHRARVIREHYPEKQKDPPP